MKKYTFSDEERGEGEAGTACGEDDHQGPFTARGEDDGSDAVKSITPTLDRPLKGRIAA